MSRLGVAFRLGIVALALTTAPPPRAPEPAVVDLAASADPSAACATFGETWMTHIFDTSALPGGPFYVNDHTLIQGPDGTWHLFGIFNREPMGADNEVDFVHAIAVERSPAKWGEAAFAVVPAPFSIALHADAGIGESHLWAPHVIKSGDRFLMFYNGGGRDDDHASIRLAESFDLYRWARVSVGPLFEDFCAARDPFVVEKDGLFSLYYTRCESLWHKVSGVALRTSTDLRHWSDANMVLVLGDDTLMPNSGYTESPFVFERGGVTILSVTGYPKLWDGTFLYRAESKERFANVPFAKVRSHAGEWLFVEDRAFITHAGPGQSGVWLSRIQGL